jgi:hypothetical protein
MGSDAKSALKRSRHLEREGLGVSRLSEAWAMKDGVTPAKQPKLAKTTAKPTEFRSEDFRRLVASIPCVYPKCGKPSQAAHRNQGKGGAIKTSDAKLFAACPEHHDMADQGNKSGKAERRAYEDSMIVETWDQLVKQGKISMVIS